jgi:hypothetical protein
MAKMQDLWRPRPKINEAEFQAAKTRTAERLADLFGLDGPAPDRDAPPAQASDEMDEAGVPTVADDQVEPEVTVLPIWPGGPRPAIVVAGQADLVGVMAEPAREGRDLVGVMERPEAADAAAIDDPVVQASAAEPSATLPRVAPSRRTRTRIERPAQRRAAGPTPSGPSRASAARPAARPARAGAKGAPEQAAVASCPYCAALLQAPPVSSGRCGRCRRRIVVKHVDGRAVYLTEAAVPVFEAERRRITSASRFTRDRDRWLKLAAAVGAAPERAARLVAAPLSEDTVLGARTLYLTTVERSFQAAKRERRWDDAARIRRDQALALYRIAGSPVPPPAEIVKLHREGLTAELRGIAAIARDAELVGATCCDACRADDGRILRIAAELPVRRLPHDGCPRGLCRCGWCLAAPYRTSVRRYLRRRPRTERTASPSVALPTA